MRRHQLYKVLTATLAQLSISSFPNMRTSLTSLHAFCNGIQI